MDSLYIIPNKIDVSFVDENHLSVEEDHDFRDSEKIELTHIELMFENTINHSIDLEIIEISIKEKENVDTLFL